MKTKTFLIMLVFLTGTILGANNVSANNVSTVFRVGNGGGMLLPRMSKSKLFSGGKEYKLPDKLPVENEKLLEGINKIKPERDNVLPISSEVADSAMDMLGEVNTDILDEYGVEYRIHPGSGNVELTKVPNNVKFGLEADRNENRKFDTTLKMMGKRDGEIESKDIASGTLNKEQLKSLSIKNMKKNNLRKVRKKLLHPGVKVDKETAKAMVNDMLENVPEGVAADKLKALREKIKNTPKDASFRLNYRYNEKKGTVDVTISATENGYHNILDNILEGDGKDKAYKRIGKGGKLFSVTASFKPSKQKNVGSMFGPMLEELSALREAPQDVDAVVKDIMSKSNMESNMEMVDLSADWKIEENKDASLDINLQPTLSDYNLDELFLGNEVPDEFKKLTIKQLTNAHLVTYNERTTGFENNEVTTERDITLYDSTDTSNIIFEDELSRTEKILKEELLELHSLPDELPLE